MWAGEVATKNGFVPGSAVGPAQTQVPWKAPCFGGLVVAKNGSMLGTAEEADGLLQRQRGQQQQRVPSWAAVCPQGLSLLFVGKQARCNSPQAL